MVRDRIADRASSGGGARTPNDSVNSRASCRLNYPRPCAERGSAQQRERSTGPSGGLELAEAREEVLTALGELRHLEGRRGPGGRLGAPQGGQLEHHEGVLEGGLVGRLLVSGHQCAERLHQLAVTRVGRTERVGGVV